MLTIGLRLALLSGGVFRLSIERSVRLVARATASFLRLSPRSISRGSELGNIALHSFLERSPQRLDPGTTCFEGIGDIGLGEQAPEHMLEGEILVLALDRVPHRTV
jgi:hypothetical protein